MSPDNLPGIPKQPHRPDNVAPRRTAASGAAVVGATALMSVAAVLGAPSAMAVDDCGPASTTCHASGKPNSGIHLSPTGSSSGGPRSTVSSVPTGTHRPADGTGGLYLRDSSGNPLGGAVPEDELIGPGQTFNITGSFGDLVKIEQVEKGTGGGEGNAYTGYVLAQFAVPA